MPSNSEEERLIAIFGKQGTDLLLKHIDNLDLIFGKEAAVIIRLVMLGEYKHNSKET